MALPRPLQRINGVELQTVDYVVAPLQATAVGNAGAAVATITYDTIDPSQLWRIERIVVSHNSALQVVLTVYGASVLPINQRDWTPIPAGFVAVGEYPQPITVQGGAELQLVVTGANPGDVVTASVQYALVQRIPGGQ